VTAAVRKNTRLPVIVKLTPNTDDIVAVARAVAEEGADAVSLINTLRGMSIDVYRRRPLLGNVSGGLSGPAVKPVALNMVYRVAGAVKIPVIGCGGISSGIDAIEFIMAGAAAVEVGTASFANPRAPMSILEEIERFMVQEGVTSLRSIVGTART
jgi:dihydroorotate dehydrogenase (NAD+) catalytic subunit